MSTKATYSQVVQQPSTQEFLDSDSIKQLQRSDKSHNVLIEMLTQLMHQIIKMSKTLNNLIAKILLLAIN